MVQAFDGLAIIGLDCIGGGFIGQIGRDKSATLDHFGGATDIITASAVGCAMIGDGSSTRIFWGGPKWDGQPDTTPVHSMFWSDGLPGARFFGIHWDCNYKAATIPASYKKL